MTYRILSLSGGGARGLFQAKVLSEIQSWLREGEEVTDHFNLITGTSTGGIIALALALQISTDTILDFYEKLSGTIFPERTFRRGQRDISYLGKGSLYDSDVLRAALEHTFKRGGRDLYLSDCNPDVIIPSLNLDEFKIKLFSTLPLDPNGGLPRDTRRKALDVALATSAAPMFFSSHGPSSLGRDNPDHDDPQKPAKERLDNVRYVDGGLWANDPSLAAIMAAHQHLGVPFEDIQLVSIGNGESPSGELATNFEGMRRLKMLRPILDMMFSTQAEMGQRYVEVLLKHTEAKPRVLQFNTTLKELVPLDDAVRAREILIPRAEREAEEKRESFLRLIREPPSLPSTKCILGQPTKFNVSRVEDDTSDLFYILIVVSPVKLLHAVRKTFETWAPQLDEDEAPNGITVVGVYDIYGSYDIVVCARAQDVSAAIVEGHVKNQIRLRNPDVVMLDEDLTVWDVSKEYLVRRTGEAIRRTDLEARAMRAFCEIEPSLQTEDFLRGMFDRLMEACTSAYGTQLIAFNKCSERVLAEFYVACGGYYDLSDLIRKIEMNVAPDARGKTTWLSFSSWELTP